MRNPFQKAALAAALGLMVSGTAGLAQSRSTITVNGLTVSVVGGGSVSSRQTGAGTEITINGTPILVGDGVLVIDGTTYDVAVENEMLIDQTSGVLEVTVDGTPLALAGAEPPVDPLDALRARAEAGDAEALNDLGVIYAMGEGVEADQAQAAEYYRQAADLGYATAQMNFAWRLYDGDGVAEDRAAAAEYASLAAEQGNVIAQRFVGTAYYLGDGVEQDMGRGMEMWRMAVEGGDYLAARNLGFAYRDGEFVEVDTAAAALWFERAIELGDPEAPVYLEAMQLDVASGDWWYADGDTPTGPVSFAALQALAADGTIGADTLVWAVGTSDWIVASDVSGLVD